jgi:hypothetical protein
LASAVLEFKAALALSPQKRHNRSAAHLRNFK